MKILVTGASGFVGSHLIDLLSKNDHKIFSLVRNIKKAQEFAVKGQYITGSLTPAGKMTWIDSLPQDLDLIIHTAGVVHAKNDKIFFDQNTKSTNNLIDQILEKYPNIHFTYISSLAAFGPDQSKPLCPVSSYGRSKLESEFYLKSKTHRNTIIRPPMVIGPRDPAVLDIFKMVKDRVIIGPGINFKTKKYSFINVLDLVAAIEKLSIENITGDFFISYPSNIEFIELVNEINSHFNKKYISIPIPHRLLKSLSYLLKFIPISERLTRDKINELVQDAWICDGSEITNKTNFSYQYDLKSTIKMTLEDYKSRNWL